MYMLIRRDATSCGKVPRPGVADPFAASRHSQVGCLFLTPASSST